jgi:hypothetical protein
VVDYDRDGRSTCFVAYYLDTTLEKLPKPGENGDCRWKGVPVNCGPRGLPTGFARLFTTTATGRSPTSASARRRDGRGSYPMTAVAADYDDDGWPDVYVACDSTPSWLFRNQTDGTFRAGGPRARRRAAARTAWSRRHGHRRRRLRPRRQRRHLQDALLRRHERALPDDGKGYFDDVTIRAGIGVETRYVGWGAGSSTSTTTACPTCSW